MSQLLYVGLGGFIGSVTRFFLGTFLQNRFTSISQFPIGTFMVNILGCFLIGIIVGLIESKNLFNPSIQLFLLVGVLGGFTTFSAFAYESLTLLNATNFLHFSANLFGQVIIGVFGVWLGLSLIRIF